MTDLKTVSFEDTEVAFRHLSDGQLRFSYWIFKLMNSPSLVNISSSLAVWGVRNRLPIKWAIKGTAFKQFVAGETIQESLSVIDQLGKNGIGAILDYSVEGQEDEKDFERTKNELIRIIEVAATNDHVPFACMKISGIASNQLLQIVSSKVELSNVEQVKYDAVKSRLNSIVVVAKEKNVPIYIDAEESWIQPAIDNLATEMMERFNQSSAIVYNTVQLYRHDRLDFLKASVAQANAKNYQYGVKLVRGAYMEKEAEKAKENNTPTPIQPSKKASDTDYNTALEFCLSNVEKVAFCAGSHNEDSLMQLAEMLDKKGLKRNHHNIWFSQLYGMSDYMSYNLANAGFNVSKYVPYGPVEDTLPYLVRRAQENTSIAGQMSKELQLIQKEIKRRKAA